MDTTSYKVSFNGKKKRGQLTKPLSIAELHEKLGDSFPETQDCDLLIQYKDEDADEITVNKDEDLIEAEHVFANIGKTMLFDVKVSKKAPACESACVQLPTDSVPDLAKQVTTNLHLGICPSSALQDFASSIDVQPIPDLSDDMNDLSWFPDVDATGSDINNPEASGAMVADSVPLKQPIPDLTDDINDLSWFPDFDATGSDINNPGTSGAMAADSVPLLHHSPDINTNGVSNQALTLQLVLESTNPFLDLILHNSNCQRRKDQEKVKRQEVRIPEITKK